MTSDAPDGIDECLTCGNEEPQYLKECPWCGSLKCNVCDMGDDVECGGCPEEPEDEREDNFRDDVEADADTLRSAGMGTDEDYGYFGGEEDAW